MKTGQNLLDQAAKSLGDKYVYGANVDISDPKWPGPWDCAEKITYDSYWVTGKIYGCLDNAAPMEDLEPYTGGWKQDVKRGTVIGVPVEQAIRTPGAILLRYREGSRHIVFSDGKGGTVEAKSRWEGVCRSTVGKAFNWDYGILLPGVEYNEA